MNVLLIVIDTLRADHLSCYGYKRKTSPNLDELAKEGVIFTRCISECAHTVPAFTSMVTGLSPISHGIVGTNYRLPNENLDAVDDNALVLAEVLAQNGYCTAAVDNLFSNMPSHPKWFARGYRYYMNPRPVKVISNKVRADEVNRMAIPWLREHHDEKFFLFLHYWDPHQRYSPPDPFNKIFLNNEDLTTKTLSSGEDFLVGGGKLSNLTEANLGRINFYDGEIRYVDDRIETVFSTLKDLGIWDDSLVIVTADHGDSMFEHNCNFDHREIYDSTINVPLIYKLSGDLRENKGEIDALVQHCDLAPTIIDLVEAKKPLSVHPDTIGKEPPLKEGRSLLPLISGEAKQCRGEVFSTGSWIYDKERWKSLEMCIRTQRWKLYKRAEITKALPCPKPILGLFGRHNVGDLRDRIDVFRSLPRIELYDLEEDPEEQANLIETEEVMARELEKELEEWTSSGLFVT